MTNRSQPAWPTEEVLRPDRLLRPSETGGRRV